MFLKVFKISADLSHASAALGLYKITASNIFHLEANCSLLSNDRKTSGCYISNKTGLPLSVYGSHK